MFGNMGVHVIKNPTGTYGFVGTVPVGLAYERRDGAPIDEALARDIAHVGPGLFRGVIRSRTFPTRALAIEAATVIGVAVVDDGDA